MNRQQFTGFYDANLKRIYRYVYFRVGKNRDVAEDLTSEVFMKALEHFEDYDPKISESAWIYRIAHNKVLNYWRDSKVTADVNDGAVEAEIGGVDERGRLNERLDVQTLLAKLTPEERELVTLKYLSGYRYSVMGEALGKSADAVKVATHRAMQKLKALCSRSS
jgi:RNA polymerase sigma-70 factor (ECF subfamily)